MSAALIPDGPALLARYGDELDGEIEGDAAKEAFLLALWQVMAAFVDLGFSVQPGDKFGPECDIGMDDVLEYLIPEDTAHETVAPEKPSNNKEQP